MYRVEAPSERAYSDAYATALAIVMADGRVLQSLPTTTED
jgi:hypothetical protein